MKIVHDLSVIGSVGQPVVLTIGNFDGVHLGHQAVLQRVTMLAKQQRTLSVVITFENHPSQVLKPQQKVCLLTTLKQKLKLLEDAGIDLVVLIPFTKEFSQQSAEAFLASIKKSLPFSHLVLGHDAVIGKDREGDKQMVQKLATVLNVVAEHLDQVFVGGQPVSSTNIRKLIQQGNFKETARLLGRNYSISGTVLQGKGVGKKIGFPTVNIPVVGLCLPPFGVYAVKVICNGKEMHGAANLGVAPTVRDDNVPILEVFIFDHSEDVYGSDVEVFLQHYLRPEIKFATVEEMQRQIEQDVANIKKMF